MTIAVSLSLMSTERKDVMVSARLAKSTVERLDFIARNTDDARVKNRSTAVEAAIESQLIVWEDRLKELGVIPKKTR